MRIRTGLKTLVTTMLLAVVVVASLWVVAGGTANLGVATADVTATAANINVSPDRPGSATRLTVQFTATTGPLNPGTGLINIQVNDDWSVPTTLDRNQITISSSLTTGLDPSDAVAPQSVTIELVGTENDEPKITLTVPDMVLGDTIGALGPQGIEAGATVTVVFQQGAGIRNPTEGGGYDVTISTSSDPTEFTIADAIEIPFLLELSSTGEPRGAVITFLGLGFKNGTTTAFFRDANGNNVQDAGESVLCRAVASSDDTATCNYTISNPPFVPGTGTDCVGSFPGGVYAPGSLANCNYINAFDGENRTASQRNQTDLNRSIFELEPTIQVFPSSARVGDRVVVSLFDYTPGSVSSIEINRKPVATPSVSIPSSGQVSFGFTIPGLALDFTRIPTGAVRFEVFGSGGVSQDTTLTIVGADLTLFQQEVIANQDLIISGEHFTPNLGGGDACVLENDITLSNVPLKIDSGSLDVFCEVQFPGRSGVELSSGGTFTATVRIHDTNGQIPTALLTPGTHELKVIDTNGALGTIDVTIPLRELEATPPAARPGEVVTVTGQKFIADNPDGLSASVHVEYRCGSDSRSVTASPDGFGNFLVTLAIPNGCAIPSTNTISAETIAGGMSTGVVDTITHQVPSAFITVTPNSGTSGSEVTVFGSNFQSLTTLEGLSISGVDVTPSPQPITNGNGEFQATFQVPLLTLGIHLVEATVGAGPTRLRAVTTFTVTNVPQAEPSFELFQDPADGSTGFKTDVTRVFDPSTGRDVPVQLGAFQSQLTYDGTCVNILAFRELDFTIGASNINDAAGMATFNGFSTAGVVPPADLGLPLTRLIGSAIQPCGVNMELTALTDTNGGPVGVGSPLSQIVLRGDARADGVVSIADALFIAQYLVGLRAECTATVDTTCMHPVNAASVRQDGAFDKKTIADALFIAQYLVGLRDEFYNLVP